MECIACGMCVDACDDIMEKVGLPKGLIRYDTLRNLENIDKSKDRNHESHNNTANRNQLGNTIGC